MIDFSRPELGYVWIGTLRRPYYSIREIRHGHNKGKFLVEYRQTATRFRKTITTKGMIRRYDGPGEKSMWQRKHAGTNSKPTWGSSIHPG